MKPIISPLKPGDQGADVAALQDALLALLERAAILPDDPSARHELTARLTQERQQRTFGPNTNKLVSIFQDERGLGALGSVDEPTAGALNQALRELGLLDQAQIVSGAVRRADGLPLPNTAVRAFHEAGGVAIRLGEDTTDAEGRYSIRYEPLPGGEAVTLRVEADASDGTLLAKSALVEAAGPLEIVNLVVQTVESVTFQVEGRVASRSSAGVGRLRVRIVDKGVGGDLLLAETDTAEDGAYRVSFPDTEVRRRGKQKPDLQARAFRNGTFLAASEVRYNAAPRETLDVRLDEQASTALQSEHETLTAALRSQFTGRLAYLQETEERQDITFLANKTGWDARAVALASLSETASRSAAESGSQIEPAFFYALFRAGLPADEAALYATDAGAAGEIWKRAIAQGVIPAALEARLPDAVEAFQKRVARRALDGPPSLGLSPLKEMLAVSLGVDPAPDLQKQKEELFADLYTRHRDDPDTFWRKVRETFGAATEQSLRLDGQLAFLTLNNAPLVSALRASNGTHGLTKLGDLVKAGYHRPEKWLQDLAGLSVPPEIPGADENERCARYAELLAQQVRLSFPTATVAQMVLDRETRLLDGHGQEIPEETIKGIHAFLTEHQGKFELGLQPVEQFLAQQGVEIDEETRPALEQIKRIQRVYQITPGDEAMNALLRQNVDSAYKVVRYGQEEFIRAFKDEVGGEANARLIHARAQQVHTAALNVAASFLIHSSAPGVGVHSTAQIINPTLAGSPAPASGVLAYPTLENLFGELDFCTCEHCRSMLNPAAYLVDLLHFLDRDDAVWAAFLANWRTDRGVPYPFSNLDAWDAAGRPTDSEVIPLQVLLSRRPDIQHVPLTCENTNTPLPYIDLVLETLEHYVANGSLAGYTGHTTDGSASGEELLANPQFVADEAYTILAGANFPPPCPFTVRRKSCAAISTVLRPRWPR